ncbi:DUF896 domain-containing protein [Pseudogracilibacillus sp. ICA-222130]|uniref:DUF896 domain-containing protein n=1 Tax=Pseudogracilibacillus sp. ICA-222130 TaxID=3134655 RepID=UPI0030C2C738
MLTKEKLERINYLAKKAKSETLTQEEKQEQQNLRQQYLQSIRQSFTNQITSVTVIDPEGNDVTPDKVKQIKRNRDK